ncbi:sensor domain-containing diguanylate cyclase [Neptunomonas phycophila]|uniref:sensor domain-containing diguanylate cyclase n=1 Tax=Neptunomonas phycophila TaxID=1572645 RepID=UPI000948CE03|nr:sensor domain-containing diguanylate cyclase [Neptunomonas phycophila]
MPSPFKFRIDLKRLILLLSIFIAIITFINTIYASYNVQREIIINDTLESNRVYAAKLAYSTEQFLLSSQQQLAYSAKTLQDKMDDDAVLTAETERLLMQNNNFNSVFVVRNDGTMLSFHPTSIPLKGVKIRSAGSIEAIELKKPIISDPYVSSVNNYVIVQSYPIFSADKRYLGYVGGSFYLEKENILNSILGEHYHRDSSYLYVVDKHKRLIYHPNRVGEIITNNSVIDTVIKGNSGADRVVNSKGVDMLAGYAYIPISGWGVVAQKPVSITLAELNSQIKKVIINTVPLAILTLIFIWFCTYLISQPLGKLASAVEDLDSHFINDRIRSIRSWYFEADRIKQALLSGMNLVNQRINKLNLDSLTDPMTKLYNRRGLKVMITELQKNHSYFSIIAIDIDHFKRINDNFGHDMGDKVIQLVAKLMTDSFRGADVLCRSGGEEFLMLLPGTDLKAATVLAERLRANTELSEMPDNVHNITISLGLSFWSVDSEVTVEESLSLADKALYSAKNQGRNRVVVADNLTN